MQKLLTVVVALAMTLGACARPRCFSYGPWPPCPPECPELVGAISTVTMIEEGVIVIQPPPECVRRGVLRERPTQTVSRSEHPDVFDGYVEQAGGLAPGETKPLRIPVGDLRMNADRSVTFSIPGNPHAPPFEQTIQPGEARYEELLARVGGLVPGERKMVTREPGQQ